MLEEHREDVERCLQGKTGITFTLYVGYKGRVVAAGGTADSAESYQAAECLADAAKSWKYSDPGKRRPAKATIQF